MRNGGNVEWQIRCFLRNQDCRFLQSMGITYFIINIRIGWSDICNHYLCLQNLSFDVLNDHSGAKMIRQREYRLGLERLPKIISE